MECINATNLHRKSGKWGTQPLLPVKQRGMDRVKDVTPTPSGGRRS